jgi:ATP adenylyltransferase
MELENNTTAAGRFAALLGHSARGNEPHDLPLLEGDRWVLAPTLGAIIPNWTIIVPKTASLNFRDWSRTKGVNPADVVTEVAASLSIDGDRILWFEHGARALKSLVGCGVDYAHLHMLVDAPFSGTEFLAKAETMASLAWRTDHRDRGYSALGNTTSYLAIGAGDQIRIAENVDHTGSQFLRKVIASLVGKPDDWNYRTAPQHENIAKTVTFYRALRDAAHRGR